MPKFSKNSRVVTTKALTYGDKTIAANTHGIVEDVFELSNHYYYTVRFDGDMFDRLTDEGSLAAE